VNERYGGEEGQARLMRVWVTGHDVISAAPEGVFGILAGILTFGISLVWLVGAYALVFGVLLIVLFRVRAQRTTPGSTK